MSRVLQLLALSAALIFPITSAPADTYKTINPFNRQSIAQLDWKTFPKDSHLRELTPYVGEQRDSADWIFLYERQFLSELGSGTERIQANRRTTPNQYRVVLYYGDDAFPNRCADAATKLEAAVGPPKTVVDTSYASKVRISENSDTTMDWYTAKFQKQWSVGNTMVDLHCLGFGSVSMETGFLTIILSDKDAARELQPLLWLECSVLQSVRMPGGSIREDPARRFVFAIDLNSSVVMRWDKSPLDSEATTNEQMIAFQIESDTTSLPVRINRYTGSLSGENTLEIDGRTANISWQGACEKTSQHERKF